jgi:hypothetical protein
MVSLRSFRRCHILQGLFDGSAALGGFATFECKRRGNKGRNFAEKSAVNLMDYWSGQQDSNL